ncbi:TPA: adhesin [Stenotrophomonas maltophilia]|uniref:adhesin n=1 Tax=Stenotrophomonas maltophilia TaxID=40324 RepID=UPI000B4D50E5|nr:adhesin [Stenotrophomonas maltophilia]MBC9114639.1 adhesin [Stenotrophomonas maltophilia]OWQ62313.1 adhesin [Stenotrophomonas maltophilia]HEL2984000.1 adhesin [Stenotrophomonas maltophilia]HEL3007048.1 adhesin [Stenotrophomonas maltophilia]HEL4192611.1 adhesin [Stenotrophomonas maltophilia]
MKRLTAFCLAAALTSCAAHPNRTTKCQPAQFTYIGTESIDGLTYGRFQVSHNAGQPLQLWVDERRRLNSRTARAEMRRTGEDAWRPYNVILEEITPGAIGLSVGQDEQQSVLFDGDGLFLPGASSAGANYSIVVQDAAGCEHRSATFIP